MRRRIVIILAGLSLLVSALSAGFWVWSCWRDDLWVLTNRWPYNAWLRSCKGTLTLACADRETPWPAGRPVQYRRLGFAFEQQVVSPERAYHGWIPIFEARTGRAYWGWVLEVPHWALVVVGLPLPAWRIAGWMRQRRRRIRGLCSTCGYDLRASAERCPECGTAV